METVYLISTTAGGEDSTGEPIPGETVETPYECVVWPSAGREDLEVGVLGTIDDWVVSFPAGTHVPADARARIRGEVFGAVTGGFAYENPFTGDTPGVVVTFRKAAPGG